MAVSVLNWSESDGEERQQFFIEYFLTLTEGMTVSVVDWPESRGRLKI